MTKLRNQIITVSVLGVGVLILLAGVLVDIRPALAQTSNTCAAGTAVPDPDNNPGLVSDCEALLAGRDTLAGDATLNWSVDVPIADWDGVTVSGSPERVTELDLSSKGLNGEIPPELGSLNSLRGLTLNYNSLGGVIPAELGNLSNLVSLMAWRNELTGNIPVELGNLSELNWLALDNNQLSGEIPAELGKLTNLIVLSL